MLLLDHWHTKFSKVILLYHKAKCLELLRIDQRIYNILRKVHHAAAVLNTGKAGETAESWISRWVVRSVLRGVKSLQGVGDLRGERGRGVVRTKRLSRVPLRTKKKTSGGDGRARGRTKEPRRKTRGRGCGSLAHGWMRLVATWCARDALEKSNCPPLKQQDWLSRNVPIRNWALCIDDGGITNIPQVTDVTIFSTHLTITTRPVVDQCQL